MGTAENKSSDGPSPTIIVPLYIYPAPGAWDSLFQVLSEYTRLHFIVVVNPHNGPGSESTPDANYTRELSKLNSYANAKTVGYVSTSYSKRDISLVLQDVAKYKEWMASYGVRGIFFDETPSVYDPKSAQFMRSVVSDVKNGSQGFGLDPLVVCNPGTVPDCRYMSATGLDITVVFEAAYQTYMHYQVDAAIAGMNTSPSRLAIMIHSTPRSMSTAERASLVHRLGSRCATVFVTDQDTNLYTSFGERWLDFVRAIATA